MASKPTFSQLVGHTIEDFALAVPALCLQIFGDVGQFISAAKIFIFGKLFNMAALFLVQHIGVARFVFDIISVVTLAITGIFHEFIGPVIAAVNALGSAGNAVSGGINSAISFFGGGSHSIPSIPSIPSTDFPVIDLFSYVGYLDDVQAAAGQCGLFTNLFYEMAFPIRSLMNDRVCPIVRYTANSIAFAPLNFVLGLFFFDAAPDGNNCADPGLWWTCFWLNFGSLLMYIVAPLQIAYALYPALKKLLQDGWQWVVILLKLAVTVVVKCMHSLHKQKKARKKIN